MWTARPWSTSDSGIGTTLKGRPRVKSYNSCLKPLKKNWEKKSSQIKIVAKSGWKNKHHQNSKKSSIMLAIETRHSFIVVSNRTMCLSRSLMCMLKICWCKCLHHLYPTIICLPNQFSSYLCPLIKIRLKYCKFSQLIYRNRTKVILPQTHGRILKEASPSFQW